MNKERKQTPKGLSFSSKLKFLAKDTFFFGLIKGASMIFPFLTIPLLTKYLSLEHFGLYENFLVLSTLISLFWVFGMDSAVARWYYQVDSLLEKKKVVTESLLIQIGIIAITLPFFIVYSESFSVYYFGTAKYQYFIKLIVLQSFSLVLINFSSNLLKWTYNRTGFALITIISPFLTLISILLFIYLKLSFLELFIIINIGLFTSALIGLIFCKDLLFLRSFNFRYYKSLIRFALPLLIISVSGALLPAIDRRYILQLLSEAELGQYTFIYKIASILLIFEAIFFLAWGPFSLSIYKDKDAEKTYNLVYKTYVIFMFFIIIVMQESNQFFLSLLGTNEYSLPNEIFLFIMFGFLLRSISYITGIGIGLSLKTYLNIIPTMVSLFIFFLLLDSYTKSHGLLGVGISFMASNFIMLILTSIISNRAYKSIKINWLKPLILLLGSFFVLIIISNLSIGVIFKLILKFLMFVAFIFSLINLKSLNSIYSKIKL